ncbi:hypothetical protein LC76P1_00003 [Lysinibacillus phage LC76P1]|nr:hypothetical protein LC76P1_00003 [Lysinibacillus phage LC76P1]
MIRDEKRHRDYIKEHYGTHTIQEIADACELDYYTVRYIIKKMRQDDYKSRHNAPWTEEENEKLLEVYGHSTMEKMMEVFKRTERAIISQMKRLTGSEDKGYNSGYLTTTQLAEAMDVTYCSVDRWIKEKDLKIHRLGQRRYIIPYKFWRWARENTSWLDFRSYEYGSIGEEPRWLKSVIEEQKATMSPRRKEWTTKEIQTLDFLVSCGKKDREIQEQMPYRSLASIKRKRLRRKGELANEN